MPITALYHLFIINGKPEENIENKPPKRVVPIEVPMIAVDAFIKTVEERVRTGTLTKRQAQRPLNLVKNLFKKCENQENSEEIDKDLAKLHERKRVLLEQIQKCDKNIAHYEKIANSS